MCLLQIKKLKEMTNRLKAPETKQIQALDFVKPEELMLKNGVKLYSFKSDSLPVIKLDIIFKAGIEYETKKLQAVFSNSLVKEAPAGMSSDETAEFFDYYGCYIESFTSNNTAGYRLYVPKKFFNDVFPLFAKLLTNSLLPEKEFEILKSKYRETLKINLTKTKYVAMKGLNTELFGQQHPRGYQIDLVDVENISLEDIKNFVTNNYIIADSIIMISGMVDKEIILLIDEYFGDKKLQKSHKKQILPALESKNEFKLYEMKESVQSSIYIGKNLGLLTDNELIDIDILNTVLGGYFGSRLMRNIREDKGYTYGIGSFIAEYNDCAVLKITSDVGVDVTQKAIDEIFKEIRLLTEKRIRPKELDIVRNFMLGEMMSSLDGVFQMSSVWEKMITTHKSPEFIDKQVRRLKSIKPADIYTIANQYLSLCDFHTVVAGKI